MQGGWPTRSGHRVVASAFWDPRSLSPRPLPQTTHTRGNQFLCDYIYWINRVPGDLVERSYKTHRIPLDYDAGVRYHHTTTNLVNPDDEGRDMCIALEIRYDMCTILQARPSPSNRTCKHPERHTTEMQLSRNHRYHALLRHLSYVLSRVLVFHLHHQRELLQRFVRNRRHTAAIYIMGNQN
jgi:hypothetical protein